MLHSSVDGKRHAGMESRWQIRGDKTACLLSDVGSRRPCRARFASCSWFYEVTEGDLAMNSLITLSEMAASVSGSVQKDVECVLSDSPFFFFFIG